MRQIFVCLLALSLTALLSSADELVSKILFGSCIKQDNPVPIFDTILSHDPDVFLFLGDNIYADTEDIELMRKKYETLGANPGFQKLRETCPLFATWDDHDYGVNDGGAEFAKKKEAQAAFLDFWQDTEDSPRRKREGVYGSQVMGPEGQRLQIILLDTRYFRSPLTKGEKRLGGSYYAEENPNKTLLGEAQWKWLKTELEQPAEIRLICSGIQIVPEASGQETWSNLPLERQRLFDLIGETGATGVILLSGDRHWAELSRTTESTPYPIYDLTSSALNQIHSRGTPTKNRFRFFEDTYHRENFGEIQIQWSGETTRIELRVRSLRGKTKISHSILLPELAPRR